MIDIIRNNCSKLYKSLFNKKQIRIYNNLKNRSVSESNVNLEYQISKLSDVLSLAFTDIEYYKGYAKIPLKSLTYNEFQNIPCMTKKLIREHGDALINKKYDKMSEVFKNTSGGSTGEPVEFYQTKDQAYHGVANYWYALNLNRVNINKRSMSLWGAQRDMHSGKTSFDLKSYLNNITTLNTFVLSDDIIKNYINIMNNLKPKFIKAYVHSIYDIAKYINKNKLSIKFTPIIHCTTGPLYPEMKNEIKSAFNNAYVYNFYGSREVSAIASEVYNEEGLYVMFDNVFVEVLNDDDKPVGKGEEGNIVITTLNNFYMPLIRYKIGDRGIKGDDLDFGCLKLDNVTGRTLGVIHKKDKTRVDGQFFTSLFFNKKGIKNFQIIQKTLERIDLKIVKSEKFNISELEKILEKINLELGDVVINIEYKEKIDLTSTGKIMYVYSELDI